MDKKKIVIIGSGPCGLGAATRLQQLGHQNWTLIDRNDYAGGLASSFRDEKGFLWDIGVHVTFSHYNYFNDLIDQGVLEYSKHFKDYHPFLPEDAGNLKKLWNFHKREVWIRLETENWAPYPFQNNFFYSNNEKLVQECFGGLLEAQEKRSNEKYENLNFQLFVDNVFGKGISKHFMTPYNFKVWGYPLDQLNSTWVGERVSQINLKSLIDSYIKYSYLNQSKKNQNDEKKPDELEESLRWGPNSFFRFPKYGGTGSIWKGVGHMLDETKMKLQNDVVEIDVDEKKIKFSNSNTIDYDYLISTMPIDILLTKIKSARISEIVNRLSSDYMPKHSTTNVVGLGFNENVPSDLGKKSWMYFPSDRSPFYRMTVLSNYSPFIVSNPYKQWSLMFEICESPYLPRSNNLIEETIDGALKEKLITDENLDNIATKYHYKADYGYPTPYLKRDNFLNEIEPVLRNEFSVYSRGRFGGWRYEVSNQDHSLMQGVESADNILFGCEEQTFFFGEHVNTRKETTRRFIRN